VTRVPSFLFPSIQSSELRASTFPPPPKSRFTHPPLARTPLVNLSSRDKRTFSLPKFLLSRRCNLALRRFRTPSPMYECPPAAFPPGYKKSCSAVWDSDFLKRYWCLVLNPLGEYRLFLRPAQIPPFRFQGDIVAFPSFPPVK